VRVFVIAALLLGGCIDTTKCKQPSAWKPCAGESAQPGASGTPPGIVSLSMPTCAYVENPTVAGTMRVVDPDADTTTLKASFYVGPRVDEVDVPIPGADAALGDWTDTIYITVSSGGGGTVGEGTRDVRIKIVDHAGNQSVPYCNSLSLIN
jgi:hypothetical protein